MKQIVLTGIKPTGIAHIGNFFGAIKPAIELSNNEKFQSYYFIADGHALNILNDAKALNDLTFHIACTWLACGLNPDNVVFYRQSDLKEVFELAWILCNVTPKGLMNRAHAYKASVDQNEVNGLDKDNGVNMGLYNYPILMAADILLFGTSFVPVGLDQKQHIEMARDIAGHFNTKYGETFTVPEEMIEKNVATILGLDGRKMSKSYGNTIKLFSDENELKKSINKIVTDSKLPGEPKDKNCTLCKFFNLFATEDQQAKFELDLENGMGWGESKKILFEKANAYLLPMREKYNYFTSNPKEVESILSEGAEKAKKRAAQIIKMVREKIGFNI